MTERGQVRYGTSTIDYEVRRSPRRKKTVELTLDGYAGVLIAAPVSVPPDEIEAMVRRRASWILQKASSSMLHAHTRQFVSGESVPYLGRQVRMTVEEAAVRHPEVRFRHWSFDVQVPAGVIGDARRNAIRGAFVRWYKARALERLSARVEVWSRKATHQPTEVLVRDQRQRWASCAPNGTLRFNWRVVMAEPAILDYVVVHELVHLAIKNHSAEFWTTVATAMPDYAIRRRRLRELGPYLSL